MPALLRRKALIIEVAAMAASVTLPVLSGMFPIQLRLDIFHRTNPLVNVSHGIGFLAALLPVVFVIWASGDRWKEFGVERIRWGLDALWCLGFFAVAMALYVPIQPFFTRAQPSPQGIPVALSILFLAAIAATWEELFFRGYLVSRLEEITGRVWIGVVASSVLFAVGHFYQGPIGALGALIFGLLAGVAYSIRRSIWPLTVAHMAVNVAITYLF